MVRTISVRSRQDLEKLAAELAGEYTVVFTTEDSFIAMKGGKISRRFKVLPRSRQFSGSTLDTESALVQGGHILMMYDDPDHAKAVQFEFIRSRLGKGEHCVYTTHRDPKAILSQMSQSGIDADPFQRKGLLHVPRIMDASLHAKGVSTAFRETMDSILAGTESPCRMFIQVCPDVDTESHRSTEMEVEQNAQAALQGRVTDRAYERLNGFRGSFICHFKIGQKLGPSSWEWMVSEFRNHDRAILMVNNRSEVLSLSGTQA